MTWAEAAHQISGQAAFDPDRITPAGPKRTITLYSNGFLAGRTFFDCSEGIPDGKGEFVQALLEGNLPTEYTGGRCPYSVLVHSKMGEEGETTLVVPRNEGTKYKKEFKEPSDRKEDVPTDGTELFIGNLASTTSKQDLVDLFSGLDVLSARVVQRNGRCKGFGFVTLSDNDVQAGLSKDGETVLDKQVAVQQAAERTGSEKTTTAPANDEGVSVELVQIFNMFDVSHNNSMDDEQLAMVTKTFMARTTPEGTRKALEAMDTNQDNRVNADEFVAYILSRFNMNSNSRVQSSLKKLRSAAELVRAFHKY